MLQFRHYEGLIQGFSDRFEPDGHDYLFRAGPRSVPIRVSAEERDDLIAEFDRRLTRAVPALMVLSVAIIVGAALLAPDLSAEQDGFFHAMIVGTIIVVPALTILPLWSAPTRVLKGRPPAGPARTRREARNLLLRDLDWRELAVSGGAWLVAWFAMMPSRQAWLGFRIGWVGVGVILPAVLAWRAWQKWRMERARRDIT